MDIRRLNECFRDEINAYIDQNWGGNPIISLGNAYNTSNLPGFIAIENNRLLGAALYRMAGCECEIAVLFSLASNQGIGTKLINAIIHEAKAQHCTRLFLSTTNDNINAIKFYQKRGFSLKNVHINSFEYVKQQKFPEIKGHLLGNYEIPILHEFEFEILFS